MATEYDKAKSIKKELEMEYAVRHSELGKLRDFWAGKYWDKWGSKDRTGLSSLFKDINRGQDRAAPDFRVVHNIIQEVCVKYQAFLSPLPQINVYVDPPGSSTRKRQANIKERYLYSLWGQRPVSMAQILNRIAWYLPLMGDCFLGIYPDFDNNTLRPIVRSPEFAFPVQTWDGATLDHIIFSWETTKQKAAKQFPSYNPDAGLSNPLARIVPGRKKRDKVEVIEYSDDKEFSRWVDGQKVVGVEHNLGFNLFDQIPFIFVPDEPFNHGAVEQAINLNEAENVLRSLLLQAVIENVFPRYVLIDPAKAPEELDMSAGAVWGVAAGGDVKTLAPPLQALPTQQAFLQENERVIKQATAMPDAQFGSFPGGSTHISGKAINEMQGAGTGSTIEMVQGVGIGAGMVSWNEKAIIMGRQFFEDDTLNVSGYETGGAFDIAPKMFKPFTLKGKQLVGSARNEVVFAPSLDLHNKLVMNLQAMGAGLVSKEYARNQMGIPDSEAMEEEILVERLTDIVMLSIETQVTTPDQAPGAEAQGLAFLTGQAPAAPALPPGMPPPPPGGAPPPGGPPAGGPSGPPAGGAGGMPIATMPGGGQLAAPALRMPGGAALPGAGMGPGAGAGPPEGAPGAAPGAGAEPTSEYKFKLEDVVNQFQGLQGIQGKVFLVGAILQGGTNDDIEVDVTDNADKQTIVDQLTDMQDSIRFHTVQGEPKEQHIEVTPGAAPEQKGAEPDLSSIIGGAVE